LEAGPERWCVDGKDAGARCEAERLGVEMQRHVKKKKKKFISFYFEKINKIVEYFYIFFGYWK
jgi:hypothetical protein